MTNWLVSESFGLEQARSREAEAAIEAAESFAAVEKQNREQGRAAHAALRAGGPTASADPSPEKPSE